MTPDYDLSNLETAQVNLWLYLHIDDICAQIADGRALHVFELPREGQSRGIGVRLPGVGKNEPGDRRA